MAWTKEKTIMELGECRRLMGLRSTTFEMYDGLFRGLGLALFNAPDECAVMVEATIIEAGMRRSYLLTVPTKSPGESEK